MRDASVALIEIPEMKATVFQAVLEYMYRGECKVTPSTTAAILHAASRLEVQDLLHAGAEFLVAHLAPETCLATWNLALNLSRPIEFAPVAKECLLVASREFEATMGPDAPLAELSVAQLTELLSCEQIEAAEINVFRALARWWSAQHEVDLAALLHLVRFPLLISPSMILS